MTHTLVEEMKNQPNDVVEDHWVNREQSSEECNAILFDPKNSVQNSSWPWWKLAGHCQKQLCQSELHVQTLGKWEHLHLSDMDLTASKKSLQDCTRHPLNVVVRNLLSAVVNHWQKQLWQFPCGTHQPPSSAQKIEYRAKSASICVCKICVYGCKIESFLEITLNLVAATY